MGPVYHNEAYEALHTAILLKKHYSDHAGGDKLNADDFINLASAVPAVLGARSGREGWEGDSAEQRANIARGIEQEDNSVRPRGGGRGSEEATGRAHAGFPSGSPVTRLGLACPAVLCPA